jgi:hypothetical protein
MRKAPERGRESEGRSPVVLLMSEVPMVAEGPSAPIFIPTRGVRDYVTWDGVDASSTAVLLHLGACLMRAVAIQRWKRQSL